MKNISPPLFAELQKSSARIDTGWLVVRTDGARFAFTSSDLAFYYPPLSSNTATSQAATVAGNGNWKLSLTGLTEGTAYQAVASAVDPNGLPSTSAPYNFIAGQSETPEIEPPVGVLTIGGYDASSIPDQLTGTAGAGDTVSVQISSTISDYYTPTNGFNGSAIVNKADASVDNMEVQVLDNAVITEYDLRGGLWNNAQIQVFWICPYHPEWGIVPLRGGMLGEIIIKNGQWTTQLRSLFQQMQQPFGLQYTLQCQAQLGDAQLNNSPLGVAFCHVKLNAPVWKPNTVYPMGVLTDAKWGAIVQPSVPNDYWYVANYVTVREQPLQEPSKPGQGLSGNDDLGPNDNTQIAVGPAPDNLNQFNYTGTPVDIFGIKL